MAVLQEQMSKSVNPFIEQIKDDLAPAGTWVATIIDIKDQFGVVRPSFDNPQVTEVVDLTTFLFGYRDQAGQPHRIASKTMRISGNEKSNLFGFLKSALGSAPKYGWDYCELKGKKCLITVAHEQKRNGQGVFPTIAALCPVPAGMAGGHAAEGGVRREELGVAGGTLNAQRSTPNAQVSAPTAAPVAPSPSFAPQSGGYGGQACAAAPVPVVDDEPLPF